MALCRGLVRKHPSADSVPEGTRHDVAAPLSDLRVVDSLQFMVKSHWTASHRGFLNLVPPGSQLRRVASLPFAIALQPASA